VLGTVKAPGRYLVASHSDSVMTLLSRAGGTTELAGSQILLFPVPSNSSSSPPAAFSNDAALANSSGVSIANAHGGHQRAPSVPGPAETEDSSIESPTLTESENGAPLVISTIGPERYLNMPVRPGDVLLVPAAGSVSVEGWVDKPGLFAITPGMTVLGTVAAAGGALFTSSATLVRGVPGRGRQQLALNLASIKRGQDPDVPVQGGDVIIVERSAAGAIPYSLYFLASKLGLGVPIIP
jgi:protein involved in polysaccharide export with SLBB domain